MQLNKFEGSLQDVSDKNGEDLSVILMSAKNIILFDTSSSMNETCESGNTKWEDATIQLQNIQKEYPGNIALFCFDDITTFHENGIPRRPSGCTYLWQAINFVADLITEKDQRLFVITDGEVFDAQLALEAASNLPCVINSIFIGNAYNYSSKEFLEKLCSSNNMGGKHVHSKEIKKLGESIKMLMSGEKNK